MNEKQSPPEPNPFQEPPAAAGPDAAAAPEIRLDFVNGEIIEAPTNRPERMPDGRWIKGAYKGGPGNPWPKYQQQFRSMLFKCVTVADFEALTHEMIRKGREDPGPVGVAATKVLFDYLLGPPAQPPTAPPEQEDAKPIMQLDYDAIQTAMSKLMTNKK